MVRRPMSRSLSRAITAVSSTWPTDPAEAQRCPSETHGYDTVDHLRVDPRLGTEADLQALLDACRSSGVRVLLDGVFNHVGRGHPRFRDLLEHGPESPAARWFHVQ